jgi:hypothetical protein
MRQDRFLMAAVAGITLGVTAPRPAPAAGKDEVRCWGINSCGQDGKCSVTAQDLAAFKALLGEKEYAARFGKSQAHSCAAHAQCGAADKILNWIATSAAECTAKGGYLVDEKDGKKLARKA